MIRKFFYLCLVVSLSELSFGIADRYQEQAMVQPEVLSKYRGLAGIEEKFRALAAKEQIEDGFSDEVNEELAAIVKRGIETKGLYDLTSEPFITIDNDHSEDLDQAMNIKKVDGGYRILYAIADAPYFIKAGGALDQRASERVFTTYLPGFDIPVLPRELSEDMCSLKPAVKRRALVVAVTISEKDASRSDIQFHHAVIESRAKLSYRLVQTFYDDPTDSSYGGHDYTETLKLLREVGEVLLSDAKERGVVDSFEPELRIHPVNGTYHIGTYVRHKVEQYNEQVSIVANSAVAQYIAGKKKRSIHRFHPETDDEKLEALRGRLANLGLNWQYGQALNSFAEDLDLSTSLGLAGAIQVSRSNYKAKYDDRNAGHAGLKQEYYDHFTAPMRRYPDVVVARILLSIIEAGNEETRKQNGPTLDQMKGLERKALIEKIQRAQDRETRIERQAEALATTLLLTPKAGENIEGEVIYLDSKGVTLRVPGLPTAIWLSVEALKPFGGSFELSKSGTALVASGTKIQILAKMTLHVGLNVDGRIQFLPPPKTL